MIDASGADDYDRVGAHNLQATWSRMAGDRINARAEADAGLRVARRLANPSHADHPRSGSRP